MLPTEDLSVYVYVLVDDAFRSGAIAIAPRPGTAPGCSDAEQLAMAVDVICWAARSEADSWPMWPMTGLTCFRGRYGKHDRALSTSNRLGRLSVVDYRRAA